MAPDLFSRRYGHGPEEREITIRNDCPQEVRGAILSIAESEVNLTPSSIRDILCSLLRRLPDSSNWSEYPNVWGECQDLARNCPWYRVYDFVERVYAKLVDMREGDSAQKWERLINEYFLESGIGWRLSDGLLESRGPEAFEVAVDTARTSLESVGLSTARQEIHESLRDLSRRPEPDLTGAIHHSIAALECTARELSGDRRATLGDLLRRHPDLVPRPLDDSLIKMWGYSSEMGRHLREGRTPGREEAELVVAVAASICSYLASRIPHV